MLIILLATLAGTANTWAQTGEYFYRITFTDKGAVSPDQFSLDELFSERAVGRRKRNMVSVPDLMDLPVSSSYINEIGNKGLTFHSSSRWMNSALFRSPTPFDTETLGQLRFIKEIRLVKTPDAKGAGSDKLLIDFSNADLPPYDRPVTMINGYPLINSGFTGKGILVAVLDGGFTNADKAESLEHLMEGNRIKAVRSFVDNNTNVYNFSTHGTAVLSILAGKTEGFLLGTATGADFILLRTEDTSSEFPCEEDFWAAGAEYADSCGADIISSSLGYSTFDDEAMSYKHSDLDGNTAFVTRAADIAASRGIIVVNSAGNERNKSWKMLIAPADGDSVLAAGAVNGSGIISDFSSSGPSADGRVKPDVAAMGVSVPLQVTASGIARGNGTSFSCPVISGMTAALLQAVPRAGSSAVIEAVISSSDRYYFPDSLYGYGIPDFTKALAFLQEKYINDLAGEVIAAPNPSSGTFDIILSSPAERLTIDIFTLTGRLVYSRNYTEFAGRMLRVSELQNKEQGVYIVRVITDSISEVLKVIMIRN
ncbi:MAG: S8 family peptidase [Bacteroidales bacterium]|nr:S8 family peptidase [Bacteroidales bacterium]